MSTETTAPKLFDLWSGFCCLDGLGFILLGVVFCHGRPAMTKKGLGCFDSKRVSNFGASEVPQLIGVPILHAGFLCGSS